MVVIDPEIENTLEFENVDWRPLFTAHKMRSSKIVISPDHKYLRKTKKRKGQKRDNEFYNLAFWKELFESYHRETGSSVYAPKPFVSEGRDLIMEYVRGIDLDRLLISASVAEEDLKGILKNIGTLQKIKENEDLLHNDFDLRHILVNGGMYVIDLENAQYGNGEVKKENQKLTALIQNYFKGDSESSIKVGFESIPSLALFDDTLQKVKSTFGGRAEYFLKTRYRNST